MRVLPVSRFESSLFGSSTPRASANQTSVSRAVGAFARRVSCQCATLGSAWLFLGCAPETGVDQIEITGPLSEAFALSDVFAPSGAIGDGATPGNLTTEVNGDFCMDRPDGANGDCYRFSYQASTLLWAGVFWQHPANNWGTEPGQAVDPVFSRVRFLAASNQPEQTVMFQSGGIDDPELTYSDEFQVQMTATLSTEWQELSLDISGASYSSVLGGFAWVTNLPEGTDPATAPLIELYLDDIVWE